MTTEITVYTSPKSAILTRSKDGITRLCIDLDGWTDEECSVLAAMVDKRGQVEGEVAPPTVDRVREIVGATLEQRRAEAEAAAARMQELLDAPVEELLDVAARRGWYATTVKLKTCFAVEKDVEAARPDVAEEISRRNAARMETAIRLFLDLPLDEEVSIHSTITPVLPGQPSWDEMGLRPYAESHRDPRVAANLARRKELRDAKKASEQAAKDLEVAAAAAARSEWIAEHGSPRLKACIAEGIECEAIYRDEHMEHRRNWLASVLPGWKLYEDVPWCVHQDGPRNPPAVALETLARARTDLSLASLALLGNKLITEVGKVTLEYYRNGEPGYCAYLEVTMQNEAVGLVLLAEAEETQEEDKEDEED
jgi:hypothetical protein